jgi:geranylgeranyl pyrophosphate synthase
MDRFEGVVGGGKMLRSRLALRIGSANGVEDEVLVRAAAAVEMMHAASLLHDDVIDGGEIRRGEPAFWVREGASGSILLGDLFVCKAIRLLSDVADGRLIVPFVNYAAEMCDAEVEQELILRGEDLEWDTAVDVARRKTGSLFAFSGAAAAGADVELQAQLAECGYAIGTAYQLADDILDAYGDEETSDKTLGRDAARKKNTAASVSKLDNVNPLSYIERLTKESRKSLEGCPTLQEAWDEFYAHDIGPAMSRFVEKFSLETV